MKAAILQQNSTYIKVQVPPDLKLRPIVAGPSSPTHRLSSFIDIVLKPLCEHVSSFIRDDLDFLNHLPETIDENVKLPFLDVLVYKQNNKLNTDIFYKATDTNQYLNFNSCHPKHTKTNIPYSLARRICCIVSDADIKTKRLNELENFLLQQNYPKSLITKGVEKATSLSQEEVRAPKNRNSNTKTLPLVLTHNPNNPQIINRIKQNLQFVKNSEKIKPILENTKLIVSRRQPKNLKKQLTQARFVSERTYNTVTQCGEPRCGTCAIIMTGIDIKLKNGKTWFVKCPMNCKSRNIIYILICAKCRSFYVGQTENLRQRVTLHRQQIYHEEYSHLNSK